MFNPKIDIEASVLNSPNKLTKEMFDNMKDDKKLPMRDREREEIEEARNDVQNADSKLNC